MSLGAGLVGRKRDLTCSWKVVLPALSSPRRRTEYSASCQTMVGQGIGGGRDIDLLCWLRTDIDLWLGDTSSPPSAGSDGETNGRGE